jgi:DNA-directed RNA polymerase subunit RPC12/RpoP
MSQEKHILVCKECGKEIEYIINDGKPCQTCVDKVVKHLHHKEDIANSLKNLMSVITEITATKEIKCKYCNFIYKATDTINKHVTEEHERYKEEWGGPLETYKGTVAAEIDIEYSVKK